MKIYFLIIGLIFLIVPYSVQGQNIASDLKIDRFNPDSAVDSLAFFHPGIFDSFLLSDSASLHNMPVYNPDDADAKISSWWPSTDYNYGMPNVFEPKKEKPKAFLKDRKER